MKERVLEVSLEQAIDLLSSRKWNLYNITDEGVRLEAPVSTGESYIVEIPFKNKTELATIEASLKRNGFVKQRVRYVSE